jgi:hypothetical protein
MSSHYKLKATIEGVEVVGESLELTGNKAFKVFPVEKNDTGAPIRGSAVVSILGKNHSISLNHKVNDSPDPEPSSTKYSYILNMYVSGTTPVAEADKENQDTAYVMVSRGKTTYDSAGHPSQKIIISDAYTTQSAVRVAVGDFSSYTGGVEYNKGSVMTLITFVMYYKFSEEIDGVVVPPPVPDEDTPASHRKRIPCRPSAAVNDWIVNGSVGYIVEFKTTESGAWQQRFFNAWDAFIAFWDSIYTNTTDYYDMVFYYIYQGIVQFNELLNERTGPITITEIDNGKGVGIHGAKNLYLVPAQQSGKTIYGAAIIPATADMLDTGYGMWFFDDLTITQIANNRLTGSGGTYNLKPKFRIQSVNKAFDIATVTSSLISNPDGVGTLLYQYVGQPFILKIYKETANGIIKDYLRPYYKQEGTSQSTSLWKSSINLMGSQNFNPLKYDGSVDGVHALHVRDIGCRGFLSGPMSGNYGLCIFQLIPMSLYPMFGLNPYTVNDDLDGEGGIGTKGINYVNRYTRYESAMGSAGNDDKYKAAFLKWPNEDGNTDPDHISPGIIESLLSKMGKNWEHDYQDNGNYTIVNRVMLVPVLWTETRLEDDDTFRTKLINDDLGFGNYLLSPNAKDVEIDNPAVDAIYRIHIDGLDIQIQ